MSGISGARQVHQHRQRPQSAMLSNRRRRRKSSTSHTHNATKTTSSHSRSTAALPPRSRPHSAASSRTTTRQPHGSSTQQVYAYLLERQAELYRKCKALERSNKQCDRQHIRTELLLEEKRQSNAVHAKTNYCDSRNAEAQHRRQEAKRVGILEKQVQAAKRRLSEMERNNVVLKRQINQQRKKTIQSELTVTSIGNEKKLLEEEMDGMLKEAHQYSGVIHEVKEEKNECVDEQNKEVHQHETNLDYYTQELQYYTDLSQDNVKKEMESVDQRAAELEQKKQQEKHTQMVNTLKQQKLAAANVLKTAGGPSQLELQQAFKHIAPYVPNPSGQGNRTRGDGGGPLPRKVPVSQTAMIRYVIEKVHQADTWRFNLLQQVQDTTQLAKQHRQDKIEIEKAIKKMRVNSASNHTKTKVQLLALQSVLDRLRNSSHNVSQERIRLHQRVQLVVGRIVEMLTEFSHPSVQKHIAGSIAGGSSGGGSGDSDKNSNGKTREQIQRDKKAALIASMTVPTILNGFRTVESECLQIINKYWRHEQDQHGSGNGRGSSSGGGGGFFITAQTSPIAGPTGGLNMNTKSILPSAKRYTVPYGPAHPHGALSDQFSSARHTIQSSLPKVRKKSTAGNGNDQTQQSDGGGGGGGMNAEMKTKEEYERFLTREELMAATMHSYGSSSTMGTGNEEEEEEEEEEEDFEDDQEY